MIANYVDGLACLCVFCLSFFFCWFVWPRSPPPRRSRPPPQSFFFSFFPRFFAILRDFSLDRRFPLSSRLRGLREGEVGGVGRRGRAAGALAHHDLLQLPVLAEVLVLPEQLRLRQRRREVPDADLESQPLFCLSAACLTATSSVNSNLEVMSGKRIRGRGSGS